MYLLNSFSALKPKLKPYFLCNSNFNSNYYPITTTKSSITQMATKVDESNVGIFCFISNLPGFRGILKQRYSDFIVNEVDKEGNVAHLTSLDAPQEEIGEETVTTMGDTANTKSYASEIESFRSLAGDSDAKHLGDFINQINSGVEDGISPIVLSPDSDKSHRTAMHNFFKQNFKFLVTDVVDGPDSSSKCIRVRLNTGGQRNKGRHSKKRKERGDKPFDSRGSENWSENNGKFLRFHLYKENKDTQEALGVIGKMLGIQSRSFGFAGTKDKRAVTTQRVTAFKQHASRLAALNERLIGIKVGDFCYVKEGLLLGQLMGNRFTITLRGVVADSDDTVKASAEALGRLGFINYFGLQRFGSGSVPTHLIGAALFRGEWKAALSMILDPREGERTVIAKAREYYKESNDIEGTLKQLPRHLVAERAILQCLKKCPGNYLQALKAVPRTLRMMYIHSYQSYLWNHAASLRVQKYGTDQVVLGDLVYCKGDNIENVSGGMPECEDDSYNDADDSNHLDEIFGTDLPEERNNLVKVGVILCLPSSYMGLLNLNNPNDFLDTRDIKVVTAEDIHTGNYTIDDVVLPMPGSRVIYPSNDIANVFHDLAKKDAISLLESVHSVKEFSLTSITGSYRRVFQKPLDFEWELLSYTDGNIPLVETDLEKIAKSKPVKKAREEDLANGNDKNNLFDCTKQSEILENDMKTETDNNKVEGEQEDVLPRVESQEPQMALKLSFTLPASCYATMAIRELLKTSTSVAYHKTLN